jgi:hypothetical protein
MPIQNYGLNWVMERSMCTSRGRASGEWEIWGKAAKGTRVNFARQIGIYVLYKEDKMVYVGRAGGSALDTATILGRVYDHRFGERSKKDFDTFSWFGMLAVDDAGQLVSEASRNLEIASVISDLEAVLIHLLQPPLNRTSGKHKHITEFMQASPPTNAT